MLVIEAQLRGLAEQCELGAVVLRLGEARRQQLEHAGDVAGRAHRLGECVRRGGARALDVEQRGQSGPCRLAGGIDRDRVVVGGERARGLVEVCAQRVAQPHEAADGAHGRAARGALEQVRHLAPATGLGEQIGERADALLVVLVVGDDALPRRDGGVQIGALLVMDLRDAHEVRALLVERRRLARAALERGDEIIPALLALEDADPGVERGQIRRVAVDAPAPELERAVGVAERLGELGGLAEDRGARDLVRLEVRLALEHGEALLRLLGLRVECGEPAGDVELLLFGRAADRGCLDVELDRARRLVQPIESRARGLGEQRDLARRILRGACGGGEARREPLVLTALLGERAQLLLGGRRIRRQLEECGVMIHRRRQIAEVGEPRARLLAQLVRARRSEGDDLLEDANDLARPRRRVVVRAQQVECGGAHAGRGLLRLDDPLEQRAAVRVVFRLDEQHLRGTERVPRIAEVVEPARRDPRAAALAVLLRLAVEPAFPQRDQIRPALVALEQTLEAGVDLRIVRDERQQLLVVADRLLGLVRDILRELCGLTKQANATRPILVGLDRAVVQREHVGPALGDGEQHREALQRRLRCRRELEHARQDLLEDLGIVAEPLVAEARRALADHLGDLRFECCGQRLAVQRDDVVGLVELGGEGFGVFPRAHRVRRMLDGGSGFREPRQIDHGLPRSSGSRSRPRVRCGRKS